MGRDREGAAVAFEQPGWENGHPILDCGFPGARARCGPARAFGESGAPPLPTLEEIRMGNRDKQKKEPKKPKQPKQPKKPPPKS